MRFKALCRGYNLYIYIFKCTFNPMTYLIIIKYIYIYIYILNKRERNNTNHIGGQKKSNLYFAPTHHI